MNKLHPGARWLFRIKAYIMLIVIALIFSFYSFALLADYLLRKQTSPLEYLLINSAIWLIIIIIIGEIYARMAYNRWFYEFTPTNFKKESGIIWKKYSNVPYERIQNVDVLRGIVARILGFSTMNMQTAGYSNYGRYGMVSEGYIPAMSKEEAEKIRNFLMHKIQKHHLHQGP